MQTKQMFKESGKNFTTNKIVVVLFAIFVVIIPYIVIWLLFGEFNLLKLNWLLAQTNESKQFFDFRILLVFFGEVCFSILVYLVLFFVFKKIKIDAISYIIMSHFMGMTTILTGLLFLKISLILIIVLRFLIIILSSFLIFFIVNYFVMKLMLNNNSAILIFNEYQQDYVDLKKINEECKFLNKDSEKDYIEVEKK